MYLQDRYFVTKGNFDITSIFNRADCCSLFEWIPEKIINQSKYMLGSTQDSMH